VCRSSCRVKCLQPHPQNGLGLRGALERRGCDFFTTDLKDGPDSGALHVCRQLSASPPLPSAPMPPVRLRSRRAARADLDKLLPSIDILITTPFHPVRAAGTAACCVSAACLFVMDFVMDF
jgi:hypothetical protein